MYIENYSLNCDLYAGELVFENQKYDIGLLYSHNREFDFIFIGAITLVINIAKLFNGQIRLFSSLFYNVSMLIISFLTFSMSSLLIEDNYESVMISLQIILFLHLWISLTVTIANIGKNIPSP